MGKSAIQFKENCETKYFGLIRIISPMKCRKEGIPRRRCDLREQSGEKNPLEPYLRYIAWRPYWNLINSVTYAFTANPKSSEIFLRFK